MVHTKRHQRRSDYSIAGSRLDPEQAASLFKAICFLLLVFAFAILFFSFYINVLGTLFTN